MKKSFKTLAAALLLGSTAMAPVAFAQDATTTPPATTGTEAPAVAPAAPDATNGAMSTTTAASASSATYLTEQAENHISVNDFMGEAIYTADNETIGNINDLLVEKDGGVVAAVVGVGGFLGIGSKDVAIPFDKITITREAAENGAEGEARLTTTETAESLTNAPEFRTLDDQAADAGNATGTGVAPTDGTTTSSTGN
ncbi:PRC-barrel domain-containing protein [Rhizobium sp. AAP43]|uniref:PRC-barrel domain-containing protein n=1 Tax=Rhizobium sp. AAP43 TaxID=1523420 RepID=UPI0006B91CBC|nr:PRC-barrel domain-containing protein [Rhizobium sp. AAP43]KPF45679.1 photosystem reaction center subunit H [Rhizobium sp. AAP43]